MDNLIRSIPFADVAGAQPDVLLTREWLVTNGLGGYASGTILGVATRRFHGLLVAALPAPLGRVMMFNHIHERARLPDRTLVPFGGEERGPTGPALHGIGRLKEFRLEAGLPVWVYDLQGYALEKRLFLLHEQNTVLLSYRLLAGAGIVRLSLMPSLHFRPHEARVDAPLVGGYTVNACDGRYEVQASGTQWPQLRLFIHGERRTFTVENRHVEEMLYRVEASRGYDAQGDLWCPGYFEVDLAAGQAMTLVASTESWDTLTAMSPEQALAAERERRRALLAQAPTAAQSGVAAELVLAADQFLITPAGRVGEAARARAAGDDVRTVIAGYHWFTDWGRDTMISFEGLTLSTGRHREAGYILRTFAQYVKDGLIPNLFPEGEKVGLYHTADATLWYFHAIHRYLQTTGDRDTLRTLLPTLRSIVDYHVRGTHFGIGIDPTDGLLRQGAAGYQLTWMDAKVGDWVVTPRRGKAVEISALWYNALRLMEGWLGEEGESAEAERLRELADLCKESFNRRFWYEAGGHLFDVVDGEQGDDPACRPNQVLAFSLEHPVLERPRWEPTLQKVRERLLTPVGLRSLAPGHPEYKAVYYGDLRSRDAAYHQGTVWAWLIGPFVDAYLRVYPADVKTARSFLTGMMAHLSDACIGSVSEIFDAEPPYTPRGCAAQAWSVAELLRCWLRTQSDE